MTRITTLSLVLASALAASCAKEAPQPRSTDNEQTPTDRATPPDTASEQQEQEGSSRWAHKTYPKETVAESGALGRARPGNLIAATGDAKFKLERAWENGPAVIVFYRGHW